MSCTVSVSPLLKQELPEISSLGLDHPSTKPIINSINKEPSLCIFIFQEPKTVPRTQYLLSEILLDEALNLFLCDIHSKKRKANNIRDMAGETVEKIFIYLSILHALTSRDMHIYIKRLDINVQIYITSLMHISSTCIPYILQIGAVLPTFQLYIVFSAFLNFVLNIYSSNW